MKKVLVLAMIAFIVSCSPKTKNKDLAQLHAKRDSLQKVNFNTEKQINTIEAEIAAMDSTINPDDLKIIKQVAGQKNRIVAIESKIKTLENQMTAREKKTLLPVAVKEMLPETFNHFIVTYGEVEAKNYANISPEMTGRINKIHVSEGMRVKKGALLVSFNTDAIDKQIKGVSSSLEFATTTFGKQDKLWKQGIGSEIDYLSAKNTKESLESQLEALQAQKRMSQIVAPFNGIVDKIFPKEGEIPMPGFPVLEFVDLQKLTITADVSEAFVGKIKTGQLVELSFSSLPEVSIKTPIIRVAKVLSSANRTFEIELEIDNKNEMIKPNMVSSIKINDFTTDKAFVIPSLAIRKDITGDYVYVVKKKDNDNIVAKKYVTT
ncbi:efflux RND transporter periplasmic adaptor subunit, partial [Bacteroidota bacterium]